MARRIVEYTIVDHGVESAPYFQGAGIAYSAWDDVSTGAGENAKEAYENAVELLADEWDVSGLPKRPRGISTKSAVRRGRSKDFDADIHYYVSVKVRGDKPDVRVRYPAPRLRDVEVSVQEERDNLDIYVTDTRNDRTVAEWHDDDARQMFDDGFFRRGGRLRASVLDYCVQHGIVRE